MTPARRIKTLFYRLHQQHHRCFYCGHEMGAETDITIDHVTPLYYAYIKDASFDTPENVVAACRACNTEKADRNPTPEELERLKAINTGFTHDVADAHYQRMLRISVHALDLINLYRR